MRLVVRKGDVIINELQFGSGPINIGRHADSQVFLPDKTVSRYHAVLYNTQDGEWIIEDLDSANKTYLEDKPIHKAPVKSNDTIRIVDFTIEINLADETIAGDPVNLDDTLTTAIDDIVDAKPKDPLEPKVVIRRYDSGRAPDIQLPVTRTASFAQAAEAICKTNSLDTLIKVLLVISGKQFNAKHTWAALRSSPDGPMIAHAGRDRTGKIVSLDELRLKDKITLAIDKKQFLLIPRIPPKQGEEKINSALIAPIAGEGGCFGVVYLDNDPAHERYNISDLDYLTLLAIHTSTIVENF